MNRLYAYYLTPKLTRKSRAYLLDDVGTGASTKDHRGRWLFMSLRGTVPTSEKGESFTLQLNRETVLRVVAQLNEYLKEGVQS